MYLTINDIFKRINHGRRTNVREASIDVNSINLYTKHDKFIFENARYMITNWESFDSNTNVAFDKALDVFVDVCENCTDNQIKLLGNILAENVVKVRDTNQLINSIKYRNSRAKTRITGKTKNKIIDNNVKAKSAINSVTAKIDDALSKMGAAKSASPSMPSGDGEGETVQKTNGVAQECFENILSNALLFNECDRILRNYNNISKRFNVNKMVTESTDVYTTILELCECIDTYNTPFKNKYNCALENTVYLFNKNYMNVSTESIVEAVTDYFLFTREITEGHLLDMQAVKKNSVILKEGDFSSIEYLFDNTTKEAELNKVIESAIDYGTEDFITEGEVKDQIKEWMKGNPDERQNKEVKEMIDEFRKNAGKDKPETFVMHFKAMLNKIYTKSPYQIINNLPKILGIVRGTLIVTSCSLSPLLAALSGIVDYCIKKGLQRKHCEKIMIAYKNEIKATKEKIEKLEDGEKKKNLEKYLEELKKDKQKIADYENNLYSDEENDERMYSNMDDDDDDFGDYGDFDLGDDFDWDDDDWDTFDEAQLNSLASIMKISELVESINESLLVSDKEIDGVIFDNIFKCKDNSIIDDITDFSITIPAIIDKGKLKTVLTEHRDELRKSSNIQDHIKIDCINENIHKINTSPNTYNLTNDVTGIIGSLMWLDEMVKYSNNDYVLEMNVTNTLKLAMDRLKKNAVKLKTKDKQISNTIDVSMRNMTKGIENAMMNDSRESIIRGTILPSASKCIKIALSTGLVWAFSPAIAVIGALGYFGCSAKLSRKERQLVLDDIEIELKMCERYLRRAEDKGDMKAVRQIEMTQRNLQRQQQRIKYKMNVTFKDKTPNVKDGDDY